MRYRFLGATGLHVSEIGFGAWAIGGHMWGPQDDADSLEALRVALDCGVNFIDTALAYGDGHSERLIARVLEERKNDSIIVATKVPPKNWNWANPPGTPLSEVFPPDHVRRCTETSLRNLKRECVEVQQLHTWRPEWFAQAGELLTEADRLKREGKIKAFGISLPDAQPEGARDLVRLRLIDVLQVFFNLFYQEPIEKLFPEAKEYGVGVISRVPLAFGALTGKFTLQTRFEGDDHRKNFYAGEALKQIVQRMKTLEFLKKEPPGDLTTAALRFPLSFPEVSTVIPGIRNIRQAAANTRAGELGGLPEKLVQKCRKLYAANFHLPVKRVSSLEDIPAVFHCSLRVVSSGAKEKKPGKRKKSTPVNKSKRSVSNKKRSTVEKNVRARSKRKTLFRAKRKK